MRKGYSLSFFGKGEMLYQAPGNPCAHLLSFPLTLAQNWERGHVLNRAIVRKPQALLFLGNMNKKTVIKVELREEIKMNPRGQH